MIPCLCVTNLDDNKQNLADNLPFYVITKLEDERRTVNIVGFW